MLGLYLDEDATSRALLAALRTHGIDATSVLDEHLRGRTDEEQLVFATSVGRSIFSHNVGDFMRIHAAFMREHRSHAGIVLVRQRRYGVGELLRRLTNLATVLESKDMQNRLEFLNDWA